MHNISIKYFGFYTALLIVAVAVCWAACRAEDAAPLTAASEISRLTLSDEQTLLELYAHAETWDPLAEHNRFALQKSLRWSAFFPETRLIYQYEDRHNEKTSVKYASEIDDGPLITLPPQPSASAKNTYNHEFRVTLVWHPDEFFYPSRNREVDKKLIEWTQRRMLRRKQLNDLFFHRAQLLRRLESDKPDSPAALKTSLEIQEIDALIDASTEGYFSRRSQEAPKPPAKPAAP